MKFFLPTRTFICWIITGSLCISHNELPAQDLLAANHEQKEQAAYTSKRKVTTLGALLTYLENKHHVNFA